MTAKPARSRIKACESCRVASDTLYRVITNASASWKLICPACRAQEETNPSYRYGGTWKADKRH